MAPATTATPPLSGSVVQLCAAAAQSGRCFACEFFTPDSDLGFEALRARIDRLSSAEPLFMDFVGYGDAEATLRALQLAKHAKRTNGVPAVLHVNGSDLTRAGVRKVLEEALRLGVVNVVAERGPGRTEDGGGSACEFADVEDLVRFIREEHGRAFCVGVAGHPNLTAADAAAHISALVRLRDAGAEFIFAAHVLDAAPLRAFLAACAATDLALPIIPSLLVAEDAHTFAQINAFCGVPLPPALSAALADAAVDAARGRAALVAFAVALGEEIFGMGMPVLLIGTLNREGGVREVLHALELAGPQAAQRRKLPWRPSGDECRAGEDVRPIFWANRPTSYVERTSDWAEFPSGRWRLRTASTGTPTGGDASSTTKFRAFQPPIAHVLDVEGSAEERRAMWGEAPSEPQHVWEVFARYVERRGVPRLPWCESDLLPETGTITSELGRLNRAGFLTINSQPRLNAVPSSDATFGWGGPGGYVYQKAYVECFCSPAHLAALLESCAANPSATYHAIDGKNTAYSNLGSHSVQAVTWGVFPGREVMQPTVVDSECFVEWSAEAYHLWSHWTSAYSEVSPSRELLEEVRRRAIFYFLYTCIYNIL